jgi:DNA invertase Pin-like site-specific DNA recombinase
VVAKALFREGMMSDRNQRPWWAKPAADARPAAPRFRGVAYYRNSARDRQENSVAIQQELVQKWATENGIEVIHEFADRGKSGLTAEGRDDFNDMMENWVKKRNDFDFVLCLDVSRWGRFQDIDLSATYSAECKKHGKQVIYTTLGMPRPDDPLYPVYVQFERFRAAQYSKELSVKVFHGCVKIAQQGYWAGGKAPYGFDRLLLDEARHRLHVLTNGQKKSIQNQRVTLTLGPEHEVATVRRVFDEFIDAGRTMREIVDRLNHDGSRSAMGGLWNVGKVRRILTNVMYAGTLVYNKTSSKLKTPTRRNPIDQWVRTAGAIDPLVDQAIYERAQNLIAQVRLRYAPETMLQHLKRLHHEHGFLRPSIIDIDLPSPAVSTYVSRFRSLDVAYQRLFHEAASETRDRVELLLRDIVERIDRYDDFLVVNGKFTVLVQPSVPVPHGYHQYWYFRPDDREVVDITLGVPVSSSEGPQILGYVALPRLMVRDRGIRVFGSSVASLDMYGHTGLEFILSLARS